LWKLLPQQGRGCYIEWIHWSHPPAEASISLKVYNWPPASCAVFRALWNQLAIELSIPTWGQGLCSKKGPGVLFNSSLSHLGLLTVDATGSCTVLCFIPVDIKCICRNWAISSSLAQEVLYTGANLGASWNKDSAQVCPKFHNLVCFPIFHAFRHEQSWPFFLQKPCFVTDSVYYTLDCTTVLLTIILK
jgi:hypothetical protein